MLLVLAAGIVGCQGDPTANEETPLAKKPNATAADAAKGAAMRLKINPAAAKVSAGGGGGGAAPQAESTSGKE
ncbi:MAG: hypothetical protein ACOYON_09830 [Fimbriimonas sp.]